ncbi:MAG: DUF5103 domain-containing protein [Bacteroidales bacterium]|nr:DUF5103 domain-containing protein [Bacteroidales bacterium]
MYIYKISCFILLFIFSINTNSQTFKNQTFKKNIETVLIYKEGWQLSFPIISLTNEDEKITLSFDELGSKINDYAWTIKYCNSDWSESKLDVIDYIDGFSDGSVSDYTLSRNTKLNYVNYKLSFPNSDLRFRKPGNYIIIIYENNDPEQIILTRKFYVINPKVQIKGNIFKQSVSSIAKNQTVNFTIKYPDDIINPVDKLVSVIIKNGEEKINSKGVNPSRLSTNEIAFEHIQSLSFQGANEYRHFDIKSVKFLSDKLEKIENSDKYYKVQLRPDEILSEKKYNYKPDINGKRLIKLENSKQSDIEADYCMVSFRLQAPINLNNGDYYVYGALSDWRISDKFKMKYDDRGFYVANIFLKQGYYNYRYIFNKVGMNIADDAQILSAEGNFYQTENDYYILTYYRNPIDMCDELIGFLHLNTEK